MLILFYSFVFPHEDEDSYFTKIPEWWSQVKIKAGNAALLVCLIPNFSNISRNKSRIWIIIIIYLFIFLKSAAVGPYIANPFMCLVVVIIVHLKFILNGLFLLLVTVSWGQACWYSLSVLSLSQSLLAVNHSCVDLIKIMASVSPRNTLWWAVFTGRIQ